MERFDFSFREIKADSASGPYTTSCSGSRSDCCTRVCTRNDAASDSLESWEKYLEVNAGVIQY